MAEEAEHVYAPESASSADGLTRSMCAMALFNAAKEDYAKIDTKASDVEQQRSAVHRKHAAEALQFAIDNGGIYIKAAQFVASLQGGAGEAGVPREYVEAFKPLTDRVPPRHFETVAPVAEEQFGQPIGELVDSIEEWPVAAASLAQVHRARLPAAEKGAEQPARTVAIKLQYPTLEAQMGADFETLKMMASMIAPNGYDFNWIIEDIEKYVTSELDFTREARNTRAAAAALAPLAPAVLVPAVVDALSGRRVMTTEFIDGLTRLDRPSDLAARALSPARLGDLVGAAFSSLALVHGLVHGDPHAGNVYARAAPGSGAAQLVILDHGLYHRLTDADRLAICELVLACATPIPNRAKVIKIAHGFAGALAPLFPALLSPAFAFATGLNVRQLRAAAEGRCVANHHPPDPCCARATRHAPCPPPPALAPRVSLPLSRRLDARILWVASCGWMAAACPRGRHSKRSGRLSSPCTRASRTCSACCTPSAMSEGYRMPSTCPSSAASRSSSRRRRRRAWRL